MNFNDYEYWLTHKFGGEPAEDDEDDYEDEKPAAIDYAFEVRDSSKINANWWVENCVTSAYGRVIGALTPSDARPTRQDMEKVQRIEDDHKSAQNAAHSLLTAYELEQMKAKRDTDSWSNPVPSMSEAIESLQATLGAEVIPQSPVCKHGHMLMKSGTSDKTGKAYHGYTCTSKSRHDDSRCINVLKQSNSFQSSIRLCAYSFKFITSFLLALAGVDINARAAKAKSIDRPPMLLLSELTREAARASPRSILIVSSQSVSNWEILDNSDTYLSKFRMYSVICSTVVDKSGSSNLKMSLICNVNASRS